MPVNLAIVSNVEIQAKWLGEAGQKLDKYAQPLKQAGLFMLSSVDKNFKGGGRPSQWESLKQSTLDARKKGNGSGEGKILLDTGRLRNTILIKIKNKDTLSIGTNLLYAKTHQFGDKSRNIPKREFLLFQESDKKTIRDYFVKWANATLGK